MPLPNPHTCIARPSPPTGRTSQSRRCYPSLGSLLLTIAFLASPPSTGSPLAADSTASQVRSALQAESPGDLVTAELHCRAALDADPSDATTREALGRICESRPLPKDSIALQNTIGALPPTFRRYESAHFVVLSDTDPQWTREQVSRLERSHHQFLRFCRRMELAPLPLQHKLVCVLFDNRETYRDFALTHDDVASHWIAGYYAPAADRVVFYNIKSNPSVAEATQKLDAMQAQANEAKRSARDARHRGHTDEAASLSQLHDHYRDHVQRERDRVVAFTQRVSASTTTHEATHMLLFHTRIQTPLVQYPLWICEGLATNFESDDPTRTFGPDCDHAPRRERFNELLANDSLLPLAELVTVVELPTSDDADPAGVIYHQSFALVQWMCRFRKHELAAYLDLMRAEPAGRPTAERHRTIFTRAFGEVQALESSWLRYERERLK